MEKLSQPAKSCEVVVLGRGEGPEEEGAGGVEYGETTIELSSSGVVGQILEWTTKVSSNYVEGAL